MYVLWLLNYEADCTHSIVYVTVDKHTNQEQFAEACMVFTWLPRKGYTVAFLQQLNVSTQIKL